MEALPKYDKDSSRWEKKRRAQRKEEEGKKNFKIEAIAAQEERSHQRTKSDPMGTNITVSSPRREEMSGDRSLERGHSRKTSDNAAPSSSPSNPPLRSSSTSKSTDSDPEEGAVTRSTSPPLPILGRSSPAIPYRSSSPSLVL